MKNKILSFLSALLLATSVYAQQDIDSNEPAGFTSLTEATQMADEIARAAGTKRNFVIAEARVQNALAVYQGGKRYILYNPNFIDALTRVTGTRWAAISVLAHEMGHHLYRGSVNRGKTALATESEADEFSGYVLEKMGATLEEAQAAMRMLATTRATSTHPGRDDRLSSIARGWKTAGGIDTGDDEEENNEPVTYTRKNSTVLPSEYIAATVQFNARPGKEYYITTGMNLVRISNDQVAVLAKISRSNNNEFPYIIYDQSGYRLYVDPYGSIYDKNGKAVGTLKLQS